MKAHRKITALVVSLVMLLVLSVPAWAEEPETNEHVITIENADEQARHVYEAYQVLIGDLDASEEVLSNIVWGSGVEGGAILSDVVAANAEVGSPLYQKFTGITTESSAKDFAKAIETSGIGDNSEELDALMRIVGQHLTETCVTSTEEKSKYKIDVAGDGWYFIKDQDDSVTADGEAYTKYMVYVIKDQTIRAKDTHTSSDKVILIPYDDSGTTKAIRYMQSNDIDAAIGDDILYRTTLDPVPDPVKYNRYKLEMHDLMEAGLTFTGIRSITLYDTSGTRKSLEAGTDYYFSVNGVWYYNPEEEVPKEFVSPDDPADAGAPEEATELRIVFVNAKELIQMITDDDDSYNFAGGRMEVDYSAVLNKNAEFAPDSNDNTANFEYSKNPNVICEGDEITDDDVTGETPIKTVETYTTRLELLKTDAGKKPLADAIFTIEGETFNLALVTAEEFIKVGDTYIDNDGVEHTVSEAEASFWKLLDGTFTKTDPATVLNDTQYVVPYEKYAAVQRTQTVMEPEPGTVTYTVASDADGIVKLEGVRAGIYTVKEIKAPDGYNLLKKETTVVIEWSPIHDEWQSPSADTKAELAGGFSLGDGSTDNVIMEDNGAKFYFTIVNEKGSILPTTGGRGTTILYVVGAILVIGAAVLLVARKKMSKKE